MRNLSSFISIGWWILKHTNDPNWMPVYLLQTLPSSTYKLPLLHPGKKYYYNDLLGKTTTHDLSVCKSQHIVLTERRLILTNKDSCYFYSYEKYNMDTFQYSILTFIGLLMIVLEYFLLYRQTEWLNLLLMHHNHF